MQILEQMPQVVSSLDAYVEKGLERLVCSWNMHWWNYAKVLYFSDVSQNLRMLGFC